AGRISRLDPFALVDVEQVEHVPEFPLLPGTGGCLVSRHALVVPLERPVLESPADLAGLDQSLGDVGHGYEVEASAVGTLEVGVLDLDRCRFAPEDPAQHGGGIAAYGGRDGGRSG